MEPCGATVAPHGSTYIIFMYLFSFIYCTSDRWRHVVPRWRHRAPQGCHPITWPADLTTANRSEHNSKQDKLVRFVEQISLHCKWMSSKSVSNVSSSIFSQNLFFIDHIDIIGRAISLLRVLFFKICFLFFHVNND